MLSESEREEEEAFHQKLDNKIDDITTRFVFADWLQERDDPRWEGYQALATLGIYPNMEIVWRKRYYGVCSPNAPETKMVLTSLGEGFHHALPYLWYVQLVLYQRTHLFRSYWLYSRTRRECEENVVASYLRIAEDLRIEMMKKAKAGNLQGIQ